MDAGEVELELGLRAFLPGDYVPSPDTRVEVLRELSAIHAPEQAVAAAAMLRDRFGRLPPEAITLIRQFRLRPALAAIGVTRVAWRRGFYVVEHRDPVALEAALRAAAQASQGRARADQAELRPIRTGVAHLVLPARRTDPVAALDWLEGLLHVPVGLPMIPASSAP